MDYLVLSDLQNSLRTRAVTVLLRKKSDYRRAEIIIPLDATDDQLAAGVEQHWSSAEAEPDGLRLWGASEQRQHRQTYDGLLFALRKSLSSGGEAADMVAAARQILAENEDKVSEFQALNKLVQEADEKKFRELVALTLFVAMGRLVQP